MGPEGKFARAKEEDPSMAEEADFVTSSPMKKGERPASPNCAAYFFRHQHHHPAGIDDGEVSASAAAAAAATNSASAAADVHELVTRADELVKGDEDAARGAVKLLDSRDASGEEDGSGEDDDEAVSLTDVVGLIKHLENGPSSCRARGRRFVGWSSQTELRARG